MHDAIIVGAGPAGSETAYQLKKRGHGILILEARSSIGSPVQCSGLVSKNIDRFIDVPGSCIEHMVKGAIIHGPGGIDIELNKPETAAYVLDRQKLDNFLAGRVRESIEFNSPVQGIDIKEECVEVKTPKGVFSAKALIGCDGPGSVIRKHFGVTPYEFVSGIISITSQKDNSDKVELWLEKKYCDGFLWKIPRGNSTEYGMLGTKVNFSGLEQFFKLKPGYEKRAGPIPLGGCKSFFERTLLVGYSAAQTKPWSGGGVVYSLTCAGLAADTLSSALSSGDLSENRLSAYEEAWKKEIGSQINSGMIAREMYKDLPDKDFANLFFQLSKMDLNSLDMDFPKLNFL